VRQRQRGPGAFVAILGALLQTYLLRRHDGDLRHGEDAVGEDEEEDDEEFGAYAVILPSTARPRPQSVALYELLSGEENLRFFGEVYGLTGAALSKRVAWCLDFVGLTDRKDDAVSKYSGGMKRRINLAAALVHDPQLLLLDEPTVGVDPQSRNKIFENIETLHAEGRTIIYTTHYMEEAVRLCQRIAIVDAGQLLALGTVTELLGKYGGPPTLVVKSNGSEQRLQAADPLAELNRIAATTTIDAFQMERPTLEQVFLTLTGRSLRD
jgi:ABC-2 type transport system ATP-binding protein